MPGQHPANVTCQCAHSALEPQSTQRLLRPVLGKYASHFSNDRWRGQEARKCALVGTSTSWDERGAAGGDGAIRSDLAISIVNASSSCLPTLPLA